MKNPFEFGRELGIEEIVDRRDELDEVIATMTHGGKLFLIGPRRFGKTSILKAAEDHLLRMQAVVVRLDAESYPSLDLLVSSLLTGAAKQLKGTVERIGGQIRKFFSRLRPELNFSVNQREWTARVGVSAGEAPEHHLSLLVEALDGLELLAKSQPQHKPVGLIIDEFQRMIELGGPHSEAQIRAAIQRHKRTGYVFAGSKTRLLTSMVADADRPFYRLGASRFIGAIPREEFKRFLETGFTSSKFRVATPDALDLILDLAEHVPYNVQMLAHACWEDLRSEEVPVLHERVIRATLDRLVRQYDPFYTQLWTGLTTIQQKTLRIVIQQGGTYLQSTKVVQAMGRGPATIRKSLSALINHGILGEEGSGALKFRFEDPFFPHWIVRFTARI